MNTREVRVIAESQRISSGKQPKGEAIKATQVAEGDSDRHHPALVGDCDQSGRWWHHGCFDAAQQGELY